MNREIEGNIVNRSQVVRSDEIKESFHLPTVLILVLPRFSRVERTDYMEHINIQHFLLFGGLSKRKKIV